jgi:hypothetical protein
MGKAAIDLTKRMNDATGLADQDADHPSPACDPQGPWDVGQAIVGQWA